jgi:hypothetical protein
MIDAIARGFPCDTAVPVATALWAVFKCQNQRGDEPATGRWLEQP